jgi:AraC family transcriptional regulator
MVASQQPPRLADTAGYMPAGGSFVLHEKARRYHWQGSGALSLKSFYGGRAHYRAGGAQRAVDGARYLLLNDGQDYEITIESETPVESLCVFFDRDLVADVQRNLSAAPTALLDDPAAPAAVPAVYERTYPHDDGVSPAVWAIRSQLSSRRGEPGWLAEQLHLLMLRVLESQQRVQREVDAMPAARKATREELYRRLHVARDYAAAHFHGPVSLGDMGREAGLSPNHLLRTFRRAFGQTPHQYLTDLRLEQARRLLAGSDAPVTDICLAVGFESLGSFSWLFRQRFGLAPTHYRRQTR